jgi:putative redox protein
VAETIIEKPPTVVELVWEHQLVLAGRSGDIKMKLDSASVEGPSPMQALAFALAGCMAMDVLYILNKGRHDLRGLKADLRGRRAPEDPHRFIGIELSYTVTGSVPEEAVSRAIELSREKYCSVWHSMRHDIQFNVSYTIASGL